MHAAVASAWHLLGRAFWTAPDIVGSSWHAVLFSVLLFLLTSAANWIRRRRLVLSDSLWSALIVGVGWALLVGVNSARLVYREHVEFVAMARPLGRGVWERSGIIVSKEDGIVITADPKHRNSPYFDIESIDSAHVMFPVRLRLTFAGPIDLRLADRFRVSIEGVAPVDPRWKRITSRTVEFDCDGPAIAVDQVIRMRVFPVQVPILVEWFRQ